MTCGSNRGARGGREPTVQPTAESAEGAAMTCGNRGARGGRSATLQPTAEIAESAEAPFL